MFPAWFLPAVVTASRKKAGKDSGLFLLATLVERIAHLGRRNEMNTKPTIDSFMFWWGTLTDEERLAFSSSHVVLKDALAWRVREIKRSTYATHLSDGEAVKLIAQQRGCERSEAEALLKIFCWRKYASDMGYTGPVAWKVRPGFTLKTHAPLAGPCYRNLDYLQAADFADEPTADSLVFWVPRLVNESTSKNVPQMQTHRAEQRVDYKLPEHHCTSFGSIGLLFALMFAHFNRTGERALQGQFYAVSDTLDADGRRLTVGSWDSDGLDCGSTVDPGNDHGVGYFLLGVEEIGQ